MAKKTPRAKCLEAAQLLARISAADENGYATCVTCGSIHHYKEMDGGHYIAKGSSSYWALEPENIHPQCKICNMNESMSESVKLSYDNYMIDAYGEHFVNHMIDSKHRIKKMSSTDYKFYLSDTNYEIAKHKKALGEV